MGRKRILTRAQVLMYLHTAGFNRARAACQAGVSRATFFNAMKRHKIQAPRCNGKLSDGDVVNIRALSDAGLTNQAVGDKFDIDPSTVSRIRSYARR